MLSQNRVSLVHNSHQLLNYKFGKPPQRDGLVFLLSDIFTCVADRNGYRLGESKDLELIKDRVETEQIFHGY